jgi:hypothetical protein
LSPQKQVLGDNVSAGPHRDPKQVTEHSQHEHDEGTKQISWHNEVGV